MLFPIFISQGGIYNWVLADNAQGDSNPFANIPLGVFRILRRGNSRLCRCAQVFKLKVHA